MRKISSYIKDTSDFILKLKNFTNLSPKTLLVTLDVKSLYTNILHYEGNVACKLVLDMREVLQPPTEDLPCSIQMILTNNNFTYEDQNDLQIYGTATGTWMASSCANLTMGHLESCILEEIDKKPTVWLTFIYNVFVIWPHGKGCLNEFLSMINNANPTIKLIAEWWHGSASFLDVKVSIQEGQTNHRPVHKTHRQLSVPSPAQLPSGPL